MNQELLNLKSKAIWLLNDTILSFWLNEVCIDQGKNVLGQIDSAGCKNNDAPLGAIMSFRMLWSFSAAYRETGNKHYLKAATNIYDWVVKDFIDSQYGGVYWMLDAEHKPLDTKKQTYAIGFALYALTEFYLSTGDNQALSYAIKLFHDIETHAFDKIFNGYWEAFQRDWSEIDDMRLSEKDMNSCKTMNTHLHILEPYTNLYRAWKNQDLKAKLENLIVLFLDNILDKQSGHLNLFFDEKLNVEEAGIISYGHDIEAAWLLHEAALVVDNPILLHKVRECLPKIVEAASEGLMRDGSLIYEKKDQHIDKERHWWVQAEAVVGFFDYFELTNYQPIYLQIVNNLISYIENVMIDIENGEWYWGILEDGTPNKSQDKAGFWKCPYHNSRMCLELISRIDRIGDKCVN